MAAVLAKGTTVIDNAAREPEIADLAAFLNRMGARGARRRLARRSPSRASRSCAPVEHTVIPDRIEAATFLAAVGVAGGEITIDGARADHMDMLIEKLGEMGMRISPTANGLWAMAPERLRVGRRRDAAVSGHRHRLQAAVRRAAGARRRRRHRHREHLQRPVPLHRRARAHGRRHPHRRGHHVVVRGRRAAVRARRCGRPTSAPAPRSWSPVCGPTARRSCTTPSTSTAATRASWTSSRSLGADVQRRPTD